MHIRQSLVRKAQCTWRGRKQTKHLIELKIEMDRIAAGSQRTLYNIKIYSNSQGNYIPHLPWWLYCNITPSFSNFNGKSTLPFQVAS